MDQLGLYRTIKPLEITNRKAITIEPVDSEGLVSEYTYTFDKQGLLVGGSQKYSGTILHAQLDEFDVVGITADGSGDSYQEVADRISEDLIQVGLTAEEFWDLLEVAESFEGESLKIQHPAFGMDRVRSIVSRRGPVTDEAIQETVDTARENQYEVITAKGIVFPNFSQKITLDQHARPLEARFSKDVSTDEFHELAQLVAEAIAEREELIEN